MLSYQHAYHAGNAADLHKHAALAALIDMLTAKPRGISYLESHAGRGLYDLTAAEARKTGEAAAGIGRVQPGGAYGRALAAVRGRFGEQAYPGSPLLAAELLRDQDRIQLCELHPAEHPALSRTFAGDARVSVHRRDGHEGLVALSPPRPRRGLALIDPSYEVKDEYARTARTALSVMRRWPEGVVMIWYPILPAGRHVELVGPVAAEGLPGFLRHEVEFAARPGRGMTGSGLVFLNLPFGAEARLKAAWAECAAVFRT